eukprot:g4334.t1
MSASSSSRLLGSAVGDVGYGQTFPFKGRERDSSGSGTFLSSVAVLMNSAVGFGMLTLPYAFSVSGYGLGIGLIVFFCIVQSATLHALVVVTDSSSAGSYVACVQWFLGTRASTFMSCVIAFYCFLSCVGAFITAADVARPLLLLYFSDTHWFVSREFIICSLAVVTLPVLFLRDITSLRFTGVLSLASMAVIGYIVVRDGLGRMQTCSSDQDVMLCGIDAYKVDLKTLVAVPNIFLSFQAHIQIPTIYAEMRPEDKSPGKFLGVIAVGMTLCMILYMLTAFFGYLAFGEHTPPNVARAHFNVPSGLVDAARGCVLITALCSIPINHNPGRLAMNTLWKKMMEKDARGSRSDFEDELGGDVQMRTPSVASPRLTGTFIFVEALIFQLCGAAFACTGLNLAALNAISGSTAGVTVIFLLPGVFLLRAARVSFVQRVRSRRALAGTLFCIIGVLAGGSAIADVVKDLLLV